MAGLLTPDTAERLRAAVANTIGSDGTDSSAAGDAVTTLNRLVDVLTSSEAAVILPAHEFLSTQQAADILGISRMTVVRLIERGELAAEGGGSHRKIAATEVARYQSESGSRRRSALQRIADEHDAEMPADRIAQTR